MIYGWKPEKVTGKSYSEFDILLIMLVNRVSAYKEVTIKWQS